MNQNKGYIDRKKVTWIHRNSRLFVGIATGIGVLVLFSRPIYDIFISDAPLPDLNEELKTYKSRYRRN